MDAPSQLVEPAVGDSGIASLVVVAKLSGVALSPERLNQIDRSTPAGLDLHVILDNSSTHKTVTIKQWLEKHPRFKLHFTPTSASWLNAVEGWFAKLERRALYRGAFTSVADLKATIRQFIETHNEHSVKPFK